MNQHPQLIFACVSRLLVCLLAALGSVTADGKEAGDLASQADQHSGVVILQDDFNREEADPLQEQVGNDWGTNSRARAQGVKQVDLVDGAMKITRAKVADHGVSVTHEAAFRDAIIRLRFKLGRGDDLGINIADMNEKSVHAGHLCVARIRPQQLEISDLKTGRMNLQRRTRRLAGNETEEDKARIQATSFRTPIDLSLDQWHDLEVTIVGDQLTVKLDGELKGVFRSEGIAHPTKSRLRLAVNKNAWVDDVTIARLR
jgi:hypothetical protein